MLKGHDRLGVALDWLRRPYYRWRVRQVKKMLDRLART